MRNPICLAVVSFFLETCASIPVTLAAQHIERVQSGLLPPVVVKGESTPLTALATRMEELHVPGVSIAVIHDGKLEWSRGFGVTSTGGPPVTSETLFQAASISKPVSAMLIMKLVEEGRLNLDTDVNQYLKTWKVPTNEFTQQKAVTLRGLLTHSAGVTVHGFTGYEMGVAVPGVVQILDGKTPANNDPIRVEQVPGKSYRYSGGGYVIAQQVVEDVTGADFGSLMQSKVLRPLGMTRSTYEQPLPRRLLPQVATPYTADGITAVAGGPHTYPELTAAGLWTTPSDLARYAIGVQKAWAAQSTRVLSQATARMMLTPVIGDQAIGLATGGSAEHPYFQHGGANEGYQCFLIAYESGDGAVVMTNSDNGRQLITEIVRTIADEHGWPDFKPAQRTLAHVPPGTFDRHVGAFQWAESGEIVTFWREGDRVKGRIEGQGAVELFPSSEDAYFARIMNASYEFSRSADGVDNVVLTQDRQTSAAKRLDGAKGQMALEFSLATEKRFKDQVSAPASEAALRRLISGIASGKPDYEEINAKLAEAVRERLPYFRDVFNKAGAIQSVTFKRVEPAGEDVYEVQFDRERREARIFLDSGGKIDLAAFY